MHTISGQVRLLVLAEVSLATLAVVAFADTIAWHEWPQLLLFFLVVVIGFSVRISDPRGGAVTPSTVLSYLLIYMFNIPTALLIVMTGRTAAYVVSRGWTPWRALGNGSLMALSVGAGGFAFRLLGGLPGQIEFSSAIPALIGGPLAHQIANNFFVSYAASRWRGTPFVSSWLSSFRDLFWPNLLSIPTAVFLAILSTEVDHTVVLAYLALLPFQWQALRLYLKRRQLYAQIVDGLVVATDANFPLGKGHARRVADLSVAIAREISLSESLVESVQFAALLHDVGMIGKDDVLDRPILTTEDAENLLDHVRVGAEIARELPRKEIAEAILLHHERFDGTGYPGGLGGEAISLPARIISLAEVVDSMAYGIFPCASPATPRAIISHISSERGKAFDPAVVDAFLRLVESGAVALDEGTRYDAAGAVSAKVEGLPAT